MTTVERPECDTVVGWVTTWLNPNPSILKLFHGSDTMLREKEYFIFIDLQKREHTYLYSSVRTKNETKLESN